MVVGADALAAEVDDGTGGGEEGASTLAVPERAEPPPDRADVCAGSPADLRCPTTQCLDTREDGCGGDDAEHLLGAGQGRGAQDQVHLTSQAATGDQYEAIHPLGDEVEELHRDATPERVPDERDPLDPQVVEEVPHGRSVRAERV